MTALEKAARALCAHVEGDDGVWDDLCRHGKRSYVDMAVEVLKAVREPSRGAIKAGVAAWPDVDAPTTRTIRTFTAMIDVILSEAQIDL